MRIIDNGSSRTYVVNDEDLTKIDLNIKDFIVELEKSKNENRDPYFFPQLINMLQSADVEHGHEVFLQKKQGFLKIEFSAMFNKIMIVVTIIKNIEEEFENLSNDESEDFKKQVMNELDNLFNEKSKIGKEKKSSLIVSEKGSKTFIIETSKLMEIVSVCDLFASFGYSNLKSSIYSCEKKYYLFVENCPESVDYFLSEYKLRILPSQMMCRIEEHGFKVNEGEFAIKDYSMN